MQTENAARLLVGRPAGNRKALTADDEYEYDDEHDSQW